jgi:hypothetical protein
MSKNELLVDLSDLATDDVEVLAQQGGRGMPEFAASTGTCGSSGNCSCAVDASVDQLSIG